MGKVELMGRPELMGKLGLMRGLLLGLTVLFASSVFGQGVPTTTWPKGTVLCNFGDGGRINTFHRGYLYLHALSRTSIYGVSDPINPQLVNEWDIGENGHLCYKMGDLFSREYNNPVIQGSGYKFEDLSAMPQVTPWTSTSTFPRIYDYDWTPLNFYPHRYQPWNNHNIIDVRTNEVVGSFDFDGQKGVPGLTTIQIGNLKFYILGDTSGIAVFDVGDPENITLLDVLHAAA